MNREPKIGPPWWASLEFVALVFLLLVIASSCSAIFLHN
jgi:hypothetical protein